MKHLWGISGRLGGSLRQATRSFFRTLIDFVYPPYCLLCETYLEPGEDLVCRTCWAGQSRLPEPFLPLRELRKLTSPDTNLDGSLAVYRYGSDTQELVHFLKYRRMQRLARAFGSEMARVFKECHELDVNILVPVPLHPIRWRERGYNQSRLLAEVISEHTGKPMQPRCLLRIRYTQPQAKMGKAERAQNVRGAFSARDAEKVQGRTIGLVDDVLTTGATMSECARVLREAGAEAVYALTIARV